MMVKIIQKEIIDCPLEREYDKSIADSMLFEFKIRLTVKKDWYDKVFNDEVVEVGISDAAATNIFHDIYRHIYKLNS